MNYFKQLICGRFSESLKGSKQENCPRKTANDGEAKDDINKITEIYDTKTNNSDQKTNYMEISDSSLLTSDSSDVVSESLTLNECTGICDKMSEKNKESFNKLDKNSKDLIQSEKYADNSSNINVLSISEEDVQMCSSNDNMNVMHENAVGLRIISMSIDINEDIVMNMDFHDISKDTNNNLEKVMTQNEDIHTIEQIAEVDAINNNTDFLTQFLENNIVDFVQTPRNISEILSSLIEFDITPNNSFSNLTTDNNDVNNCDDDYVLMDLDAIVDEIESMGSYINDISNTHNVEVLNAITAQDVDNILNENVKDITPSLSYIGASDISIDLISSSSIRKKDISATNYDFSIEIDVQTISSQHSDNSSDEVKSDHENKSDATEKQLDIGVANENSKDIFDNTDTRKSTEIIHIENLNKPINKHKDVKIIDTIIISSSDDEENYPLALLKKRKNFTVKNTRFVADHISISSNESNTENKDDPDYCSGYESSDFEFISETEAKKSGLTIKKHSTAKTVRPRPKKTFEIRSIERLNSDPSEIEYLENAPGTSGVNYHFEYNINQPGSISLNNNVNIQENQYSNKPVINRLHNVNRRCPGGFTKVNVQCPSGFNNVNHSGPSGFNSNVNKRYTFNKPGLNRFNNNNNRSGTRGIKHSKQPGTSCRNNNQPGPSSKNNSKQLGTSDLISNQLGPSGISHSKQPGTSCLNNNQPNPSCLNIRNQLGPSSINIGNQQGTSCLNNSNQLGTSDLISNQLGPSGISHSKQPGTSCLNNNQPNPSCLNIRHQLGPSSINIGNQPGTSCLNNSNQPGPSCLNKNKSDLNNKASTEDHVIPEGEEYLNLFQGMYERALRPNPYSLENKSIYEPNPRIPGMFIDMHGVGFDLAARQNQPYDEDIDDETREEARENRNRILQMYDEENIRKKRH